ncbi:MAG: outer membrane beta-barrel protein [Elusimicrobiota bacterium]
MRKLLAASAVSCLLASTASANLTDWNWLTQYQKPNMHYGQLALHPYYKLSEVYDSNIFLVPRDLPSGQVGGGIHSSWITKNDLGLEANLPWQHINNLSLGYDFESDVYTTMPSLNNTINQAAHVDYVRAGAQGVTYKAGDQYVNTTDQAFSELIQRARRWSNRVYAEADYTPKNGRLAGGVTADHETDKYLDATLGAGLNRYQEDLGFNVGYMVQPKTKVYVSYLRGIIHYTVNPPPGGGPDKDNKSHTVAAGVTGQLTPKITGQVEGGMVYREYDAAPFAGGAQVERSASVSTSLTYKPDKYSNVILALSRFLQESLDPSNPFYISNNASLDLDHKFPHKVTAGINLAVGIDEYTNAQTVGTTTAIRRDDLYQGGAWVEYDVQQWLSTGLAYVYRERDSIFSGQFNYQESQVIWNASLKF